MAKAGEEYLGLNGRMNSLENLIVLSDQQGPFGSPFVDSTRAPVTEETKNALQVIFLQTLNSVEKCGKAYRIIDEYVHPNTWR